ncbi:hypothetical protein KC326_g164 [Hortaea werneckii]|nr:hypothetical protein KC326_g164 [Hortaea werneckii]
MLTCITATLPPSQQLQRSKSLLPSLRTVSRLQKTPSYARSAGRFLIYSRKNSTYWKLKVSYLKIAEMRDVQKSRSYHVTKRMTS